MNNKEKQELKELIREVVREVVREELAKEPYGFIPDVKPKHTIDIQPVPMYACPVMDMNEKITYTTNTEDLL